MASPELLRVRAVEGVNVTDWRVPARHGQRVQYVGRAHDGVAEVATFRRSDGPRILNELRRALAARDLVPADDITARWSGVALPLNESTNRDIGRDLGLPIINLPAE